jgi:choline dehydrogenase-like flavoprotein
MPQDSLHINGTASRDMTYDAIVVGSGISGGWAAKELCEKGLRTLLIERGRNVEHIKDYPTATLDPWQVPHAGRLTEEDRKTFPIQTRHYSINGEDKHFYVKDLENKYVEVQRYDWVRADVLGGRSLLWARMCFRWSDLDFGANAKDGHGSDWPIRYKDIAPWYEYVERFVGVSGQAEGLPHLPDSLFLPPMEMTCVEKHVKAELEKKFPGRILTIGRTANLTRKIGDRGPCQYRNLCHRGCPFGGYFSTNSATLPAAMKTGKLTVLTDALVNRVLLDKDQRRATGVELLDRNTGKTYTYHARLVSLNASTLGTTFLLLNSKSSAFPDGIGNNHDMVGRHLMDHHKDGGVSGEIEGFTDKYYYGRRPTGTYIPRFRNLGDEQLPFVRGYGMQCYSGRGRGDGTTGIGADFKEGLTELSGWTVGLGIFGETLPYAENRVTLDPKETDKWGRPSLRIDAAFRENEKAMRLDAIEQGKAMLEKIGAKNVKHEGEMSFPGNANHEMGTARMGFDPKTSVLNKWNQVHEIPNLLATDGSCMASTSCVNPSLTYMALTARAVDHAVAELKKGNI